MNKEWNININNKLGNTRGRFFCVSGNFNHTREPSPVLACVVETDITGGALYFHSYTNPSDWEYHNDYTQVYISGTEKFWFYK